MISGPFWWMVMAARLPVAMVSAFRSISFTGGSSTISTTCLRGSFTLPSNVHYRGSWCRNSNSRKCCVSWCRSRIHRQQSTLSSLALCSNRKSSSQSNSQKSSNNNSTDPNLGDPATVDSLLVQQQQQQKQCYVPTRLRTFQQMLYLYGAPGSEACRIANDLIPIVASSSPTLDIKSSNSRGNEFTPPELVTCLEKGIDGGIDVDDYGHESHAYIDDKKEEETKIEKEKEEWSRLHPFVLPIAKSVTSGHYIGLYRNPLLDDDDDDSPHSKSRASAAAASWYCNIDSFSSWPVVETAVHSPGVRLLALKSEQMMRRMVVEADFNSTTEASHTKETQVDSPQLFHKLLNLYQQSSIENSKEPLSSSSSSPSTPASSSLPLSSSSTPNKSLDYIPGSVHTRGIGLEKYLLLHVGPFVDVYQILSRQHWQLRGDSAAAYMALEAAIRHMPGFASPWLSYARGLTSLSMLPLSSATTSTSTSPTQSVVNSNSSPSPRLDEARDAARNCLRLPLATLGLSLQDFHDLTVLAQLHHHDDEATASASSSQDSLALLQDFYLKVRAVEKGDTTTATTLIPTKELALEEANEIMNMAVLNQTPWHLVRPELARIFRSVDALAEWALFVEKLPSSLSLSLSPLS